MGIITAIIGLSMDSVIAALESALSQNPDDLTMRLHLGELLLDSNRAEAAREHFETVLQKDPANLEALQGAATVADRLGDEGKAASYKKGYVCIRCWPSCGALFHLRLTIATHILETVG